MTFDWLIKSKINYLLLLTGLNHEQNIKKMRILSFMQMAETNPEITFDEIVSELQIEEKEVEAFIIEGIQFLLTGGLIDSLLQSRLSLRFEVEVE